MMLAAIRSEGSDESRARVDGGIKGDHFGTLPIRCRPPPSSPPGNETRLARFNPTWGRSGNDDGV